MTNHFAFTGTKIGWTEMQSYSTIDVFTNLIHSGYSVMHNGDCIGSDVEAYKVWKKLNGIVVGHPPINPKYRAFLKFDIITQEGEYIERDHDMVNASNYLVGTPKTMYEFRRSGTWATIRYAQKIGLPHTIIYPDGSVVHIKATNLLC